MASRWDWTTFIIGILFGLILGLFIFWVLWVTKSFVFANCANNPPICMNKDYYDNPGSALQNGAKVSDILFLNDNKLYYKRKPKNSCTPSTDQEVPITQPQWCNFVTQTGQAYQGRNYSFGSPVYDFTTSSGLPITVTSEANCVPLHSTNGLVTSGAPLLKWDPTPVVVT